MRGARPVDRGVCGVIGGSFNSRKKTGLLQTELGGQHGEMEMEISTVEGGVGSLVYSVTPYFETLSPG